jgi:hypothetical protein
MCLFAHYVQADADKKETPSEIGSKLSLISTSHVYCATLKLYDVPITWRCIDSSNQYGLSVDMPNACVQVIRQQSNSLVVFVNKLTGQKFYARANVSPILNVAYTANTLEVKSTLVRGRRSERILHADLSDLIKMVSAWRCSTGAFDGGVKYFYESDDLKKKARFNFQGSGITIELFRESDLDTVFIIETDCRVKDDFIVAMCNNNDPDIADFSGDDADRLINAFISFVANGALSLKGKGSTGSKVWSNLEK